MRDVSDTFSYVAASIIGLATAAVVLSQRANTANVIGVSGSGVASVLRSALSPIFGPFGNVGISSAGNASAYMGASSTVGAGAGSLPALGAIAPLGSAGASQSYSYLRDPVTGQYGPTSDVIDVSGAH